MAIKTKNDDFPALEPDVEELLAPKKKSTHKTQGIPQNQSQTATIQSDPEVAALIGTPTTPKEQVEKEAPVLVKPEKTQGDARLDSAKQVLQKAGPKKKRAQKALPVQTIEPKEAVVPRAKRSKKYLAQAAKIDKQKNYPLDEAIALVKETSYTKFDGTIEAHVSLAQKETLRQPLVLPHGTGKSPKVLVLAAGTKASEASQAGADHVGSEEFIEKIAKGWLDFAAIVATPEMMPKIARVAKILGPKGLMPNPKTGTITDNPALLVKEIKNGRIELRSENQAPVVHLAVGKTSFTKEQLAANLKTLVETIGPAKINRLTLAATMGPGIRVDLAVLSS